MKTAPSRSTAADISTPPEFAPVPRGKGGRHDGWTDERQREFIVVLAATGSVLAAVEAVGMKPTGAYRLRHAPGAKSFAAAWEEALDRGTSRVRDVLIDQSIHGIPEPIVYGGKVVGQRRRFNHRSMMWLLQHHRPDQYPGAKPLHAKSLQPHQMQEDIEVVRARVEVRLDKLHARLMRDIVSDPLKRAGYEVCYGRVDWHLYDGTRGTCGKVFEVKGVVKK